MESLRPRGVIEYLEILWRKKSLIFLVAASVLIATLLIIRRIPDIYESRTLIVISGQSNDDQSAPGALFASLTQQLTSRGNLAAIIRSYNLYRKDSGQSPDSDAAVAHLRKEIKLDIKMRNYYPEAPESLAISYRYSDPTIAQRVISDLVQVFEQANAKMREQSSRELERANARIAEVETQLNELAPQRELAALRNESAKSPDNDPSAVRAQRFNISSSIDSLDDKEFMLERQIDEQKRQIAEQEKQVGPAAIANGLASSGAYGVLLARRAEIEAQVRDLAAVATEKNPKMIQARSQLAVINREIARLESTTPTTAAILLSPEARELRVMQRELQRLQTELDVTRRDLNRKTQSLVTLPTPAGTPATADAARADRLSQSKAEYDRLLGRYNWLKDKQDSLQKISGVGASNTGMFQVIDSPNVSRNPVAPNRNLLRLLGLGIALGLGLLVTAAREFSRLLMINNDRDVEYYLGVPVLAMIPETLTTFERTRRRRLWILRWLGLGLLSLMMIPICVVVLDRTQIFQLLGSR
ncbi:MAG TPA: Wzz/FepE/Etk N-terminal domain-containing protein [Blastocatellia bacterium]